MKTKQVDNGKRQLLGTSAVALAALGLGAASARAQSGGGESASVEDRLAHIEHELMRVQAVTEIQNLMGRYEAIHIGQYIQKTWELYARHTPNTWMDISNWGVFVGIDSIKRAWTQGQIGVVDDFNPPGPGQGGAPQGQPPGPGQGEAQEGQPPRPFKMLAEHPLTTPVIQVAGDGQTAKALWFSPGMEMGGWAYGKYGIDFVKEDGMWRIWHLKWFRVFITPWDQSYTESQDPPPIGDRKPDRPIQWHKPFNSDDWVEEPVPPAPKPYHTWTEADDGWMFRKDENWGEGTVLGVPE